MAFHIEIETNIDDASLDVESCEEVITFLENSYNNVRAEIYSYCLGMRTLRYALISIVVLGILFFISHSKLFLFGMPIVTLLIMLGTISLAESTSVAVKKQVKEKIEYYKRRLKLLKECNHKKSQKLIRFWLFFYLFLIFCIEDIFFIKFRFNFFKFW